MEIVKREKQSDFRVRQLRAQQMLRGELEGDELEQAPIAIAYLGSSIWS